MDCLFCSIAAGDTPAEIVFSDAHTTAFLDHRPLFHGHTLLIPRSHHVTLADLPGDLVEPYFRVAQMLSLAVTDGMKAVGSFVALNNVVSQSVPHLHTHIVPRRPKDGLRGFFWPRTRYDSEEEMQRTGDAIRRSLERAAS